MSSFTKHTETSDERYLCGHPVVSIHMLVYLHATFLAQAIQGVVDQDVDFEFELIIAEDRSPDGSLAIALDYQKRYPDIIRVLSGPENVGMVENAGRCLRATRGRYIAACEGDDYWCDPSKLSRQVMLLENTPDCMLVYHAAKYVDAVTGLPAGSSRQSLFSRFLTTEEVILGDGGLIPTASIMLRTSVANDQPKWWLEAPIGDYPVVLRAASLGRVAYIDRFMCVYRKNVAHSWTTRYVSTFDIRIAYARRVDAMLRGFDMQTDGRFRGAVAEMISKYYSDVMVRIPAERSERRAAYVELHSNLRGLDKALAWLATETGIQLIRCKDIVRKAKTVARLLRAHLATERIADAAPAPMRDART